MTLQPMKIVRIRRDIATDVEAMPLPSSIFCPQKKPETTKKNGTANRANWLMTSQRSKEPSDPALMYLNGPAWIAITAVIAMTRTVSTESILAMMGPTLLRSTVYGMHEAAGASYAPLTP